MRLDEKARENLEAVERLLMVSETSERLDDAGDPKQRLNAPDAVTLLPLNNAAASRAYYAAYQAVADRASREGIRFDATSGRHYRHDFLPDLARHRRILDDDQSEELQMLYGLRVKADYLEDQVDYDEAANAAESAKRIVHALLGSNHDE